ncbi:MAG: SDR family oxidoreductase [Nitrosopumilus sp.]|nr:SDR family oxidoreductase [Nitrosopumilus sp.]CAI9832187.1 Short-chain dehydrogenase/reductase SDR [Nitrosopumilaceae archaeon]MDA7941318.1 SDR family oxidoreductase [Nitrosopumilus sp.]MDA7942729.1 SDR family oxidoreductase [Nitrosopumilus sp.]MDA7945613.1 SDR family oxidoreductase [Nitrosopumilus sp.]
MEGTALVTGCSSGIGLESALALARGGRRTIAGMRDPSRGGALEEAAQREGLDIKIVRMDVDDEESVSGAVAGAGGDLDVLVNNAGYMEFGCAEDVPLEAFRRQFETNFFGVVRAVQEALPVMRGRGRGTIINISSVVGRMGLPGSSAYVSSKFALEGFTECLRYEVAPFGIRAALVEPGVTKTGFFGSMRVADAGEKEYKEMTGRILSGIGTMVEMGTPPSEAAAVVASIAGAETVRPRYVVGADAAMFMEARGSRGDAEFEEFVRKEVLQL